MAALLAPASASSAPPVTNSETTPLTTIKENTATSTATSTTSNANNDNKKEQDSNTSSFLRGLCSIGLILVMGMVFFSNHRHQSLKSKYSTSTSSIAEQLPGDDWVPDVAVSNYGLSISLAGQNQTAMEVTRFLFNTGLMECFGFAFTEGQKTASQALDQDCTCPMCYWLLAMSYSPFINHPSVSKEHYKNARKATRMAVQSMSLVDELSAKERGLITAMHLRFSASPDRQTDGYQKYQTALVELYTQFPEDPDIMAFLADAIMILHCDDDGYHFYESDGRTPRSKIGFATELLEKCLKLSANPLCQHLYIHMTEPSASPDRALDTANRLRDAAQTTQAQHLQHMPSHTYLRVGNYHDAVLSNVQAHDSDQAYLEHHHQPYGPAHDTAFLIHAAQTTGEKQTAYDYADQLREHYRQYPDNSDYPGPEMGWHIWRTVRLRFGDFQQVLDDDEDMPREWPYAQVLSNYTKGAALLGGQNHNKEDRHQAKIYLESLQAVLPDVDESLQPVAKIANLTLASALAYWNGRIDTARELLTLARHEQDGWAYTEPPAWYLTVAQCQAVLWWLLADTEAAENVFNQDLQAIPENRQSLYGLWKVLTEAQADNIEIEKVRLRYETASKYADDPNIPPVICPQLGV